MEHDPSRRRRLPPRSASLLDLSSHRRHLSTSLFQSPATTPRFGLSSSLGSSSVSGYDSGSSYQVPSSPLAPTSGGGADVGGSSARHVRSFSQTSLGAGYGSSSKSQANLYPLPPITEYEIDDPDDIVSQFLDLESLGELTSSGDGTEELRGPLAACQMSGGPLASGPTDSSQNVAESWAMSSAEKNDGSSSSVESFTGNLNSGSKEKLPLPYRGPGAAALFEYANGKFSEARMKKIMADQHLADLMLTDPGRAKRLLNNRQSAAKGQDRKALYRSKLEGKLQKLKMEASTLSAQLTWLQTKSAELTTENDELKFRLQSVEKLGQLKDALNEALSAEVQRLKLTTNEIRNSHMPNGPLPQMSSQLIQSQGSNTDTGATITVPANSATTSRTIQLSTTMAELLE